MKIFAILHGQTDMNEKGLLQSRTDSPLSAEGKAQALEVAKELTGKGIDVIMAAPEIRSAETATIIAGHLGIDNSKIAKGLKLNERDYGDFEGHLISEVDSFALGSWEINAPTPNGEDIRTTAIRVTTYMNDMVEIFKDMTLLVIVSPNVMRTLFWYFKGLPDYGKDTFIKYKFGDIFEFDTEKMPSNSSTTVMETLDPDGNWDRDRVLTQKEIDSMVKEMGITLN